MRWLWGVCLALAVLSGVSGKPASLKDNLEDNVEVEYIKQLLNKLLAAEELTRVGRELADEEDVVEEEEVEVVEDLSDKMETEAKALEDSEAVREAKIMEVSRFNNYIDAIYRRMNAALKAKLMDPMELNLDEKVKKNEMKNENKKEKLDKTRVLREALDFEEKSEVEIDHKMGKVAKNHKKSGKGKSKEERIAERERKKEMRKKKMDAKNKKKERKEKKAKNPKEKKSLKSKKKNKNERESRSERKNRNKKGQKKNKQENKSARHGAKKKGKDSMKKNMKRGRKGNDDKNEKMVGSLSGIATMMRDGDVTVLDEENHKVVTSEFSVGPLQLQVSKIYGKGKARTVRTAKAITDVMSGTLTLKVKPDGTAHVKKVVFKKPENVEVKGKLSENNPRSLNYLKNSVNKMRPLAAMKILKTARYVLKAPSSKE